MEPDKWVSLRDGRGGSLGLQYEAYYEIDRLRAQLAIAQEALEQVESILVRGDKSASYMLMKVRAALQQISPPTVGVMEN